jgi:PadR family transcriptional regulator, regulatory protein PadR
LIWPHILHHAVQKPIFCLLITDGLSCHGCRISVRTIYPIPAGLEPKAIHSSKHTEFGLQRRRIRRVTAAGWNTLLSARHSFKELFGELFEERE